MSKRRSDGKTLEQLKTVILADQDQDIENAKAWIRDDPGDLLHLWELCNKDYPNPSTECMTRFAIIGITHVLQQMDFIVEDQANG